MQQLRSLLSARDPTVQLEHAVEACDLQAVRVAVQKGAKVDGQDHHEAGGRTPLQVAAARGQNYIVGELLDRGANTLRQEAQTGRCALHLAAEGGHLVCVNHLLGNRNRDPHREETLHLRDVDGLTPLLLAAGSGHEQVVRRLLQLGALKDDVTPKRMTAAHLAATSGHTAVLAVLAEAGLNLDAPDKDRRTPLHSAAAAGRLQAVQFLLEARVDVSARTLVDQYTACDIARVEGHHAVLNLLKQYALRPPASGPSGRSGPGPSQRAVSRPSTPPSSSPPSSVAPGRLLSAEPVYAADERYSNYPSLR